jgi:NADPH:quinone reductase-like Zn-dependent oxidoreductase
MKMTQMKAAQVSKPGADFEIVEREIPTPDAGHVRIKVQACGVCHSDVLTKDGLCPEFSIPAFQATKWQASSTKWAPVFPRGKRGSVWA